MELSVEVNVSDIVKELKKQLKNNNDLVQIVPTANNNCFKGKQKIKQFINDNIENIVLWIDDEPITVNYSVNK